MSSFNVHDGILGRGLKVIGHDVISCAICMHSLKMMSLSDGGAVVAACCTACCISDCNRILGDSVIVVCVNVCSVVVANIDMYVLVSFENLPRKTSKTFVDCSHALMCFLVVYIGMFVTANMDEMASAIGNLKSSVQPSSCKLCS